MIDRGARRDCARYLEDLRGNADWPHFASSPDLAHKADTASSNWTDVPELETNVALENADIGSLYYLTNAKVRSKLKQTVKAASTESAMVRDDRSSGLFNGLHRSGPPC